MLKHLQILLLFTSCIAQQPTPHERYQQAIKSYLRQAMSTPPTDGAGVMVLLRAARRLAAESPLSLAEQILTTRLRQPLTSTRPVDSWWLLATLEAHQSRAANRYRQTATTWIQKQVLPDDPLAIGAHAKIFQVFREPSALEHAQKAAANWLEKPPAGAHEKVHGLLSLIYLYQADFDPKWYDAAMKLAGKIPATDLDPPDLGILALSHLLLANLSLDDTHLNAARQIIADISEPVQHPEVLLAMDFLTDTSKEVAVVGPPRGAENVNMVTTLQKQFLPNVVIASGEFTRQPIPLLSGKPLWQRRPGGAFVCERGACKFPTADPAQAVALANGFLPLN